MIVTDMSFLMLVLEFSLISIFCRTRSYHTMKMLCQMALAAKATLFCVPS